jgi:alcohol dehydrogenase (cytochrome c)
VTAKLSGNLPDIPAADLARWLAPGSPVYIEQLAETPSPHSVIANLRTDESAVGRGRDWFLTLCAVCHGDDARGKVGPDLVNSVANNTDWAFFSITKWGRRGTAMMAQPLDDGSIWDVHAFLRREAMSAAATSGKAVAVQARDFAPTSAVPATGSAAGDWLTYAGNYAGHRHAELPGIDPATVADLQVAWVAQLRPSVTPAQSSPIVSGGLLFVTESREGVVALEASSGKRVWHFRRSLPEGLKLCCGYPNRGAAILGDTLFVTTLDAHLVALDAATGAQRWITKVADYADGYSITGAPLAFGDQVVVGVAGSLFGIRGHITAYSARDGRQLWRFWTVPGPGEPGHETWAGASWKAGGGATWTVGSYDSEYKQVIWGVGNPSPVFNGDLRKGDNLFTNSAVALDASTGRLRWHYQFTPNDEHDWDAAQQPVLTEIQWQGEVRPAVLWANRNAFFYALDRRTGEFLFAKPFVKQTWASDFDSKGRPQRQPGTQPKENGTLVWPVVGGATSWWPPSLDVRRRLVFIPTVEAASIYFRGKAGFAEGNPLLAGSSTHAAGQRTWAGIKAIDVDTGDSRWHTTLREGENVHRTVGGVLSTDTGLLFAGYEDVFYAFDSDRGRIVWSRRLGAKVSGPPIAFTIGGRNHIAVAAGNSLFAFAIAGNDNENAVRRDSKSHGQKH